MELHDGDSCSAFSFLPGRGSAEKGLRVEEGAAGAPRANINTISTALRMCTLSLHPRDEGNLFGCEVLAW